MYIIVEYTILCNVTCVINLYIMCDVLKQKQNILFGFYLLGLNIMTISILIVYNRYYCREI